MIGVVIFVAMLAYLNVAGDPCSVHVRQTMFHAEQCEPRTQVILADDGMQAIERFRFRFGSRP